METPTASLCTSLSRDILSNALLKIPSYLSGKTKEQAFRIGHDIADTITALNPSPVKLKFEKARRLTM